eukprot:6277854-Prymnesium_polylepis.2
MSFADHVYKWLMGLLTTSHQSITSPCVRLEPKTLSESVNVMRWHARPHAARTRTEQVSAPTQGAHPFVPRDTHASSRCVARIDACAHSGCATTSSS